jgi:hypothetical protein
LRTRLFTSGLVRWRRAVHQATMQAAPQDSELLTVAKTLRSRMAEVAKTNGTESAWDWIEAQVGLSLPELARVEIEGFLIGWLLSWPKDDPDRADRVQLAKAAASLADSIAALGDETYYMPADGDGMYDLEHAKLHLLPRLRALADVLPHDAKRSRVEAYEMLIRSLADIFRREVDDRITTTPNGHFCRFLVAVLEILPRKQRSVSAGSFVQYARRPGVLRRRAE